MPIDRLPSKRDLAAGADHAAERAQRRGLAGAVGAEQGRDAAFLQTEIEAVQHLGLRRRPAASPSTSSSVLILRGPEIGADHVRDRCCTIAGVPSAIFLPKIERHDLVGDRHHQAHVMLDEQDR